MRLISVRRLVSTVVGVILAIAIIFSMLTVTNNATKSQIYESISHMQYQFYLKGFIPVENYSKVVYSIYRVPHVDAVSAYISTYMDLGNGTFFMVAWWNDIAKSITMKSGRLPVNADEMAISYWFARVHNISIGEHLHVTKSNVTGSPMNLSYRVVGIYYYQNAIIRADAIATGSGMERYGVPNSFVAVKLNTSYLLSSLDSNEISRKIGEVEDQVEVVIDSYGGVVISSGYGNIPQSSFIQPLTYIVYSLPVIFMGIYLSKVVMEIELTERRREFGVLRVRGASKNYIIRIFLYEVIIYSVLGGIAGYLLGEGVAYVANKFVYHLPYFTADLNIYYALSGILLSFVMFLVAFHINWRNVRDASISELLSHFSEKYGKVEYHPGKDIAYSALLWLYLAGGLYLLENTDFNGGFSFVIVIAAMIAISFAFLLPVVMVLLPLYTVRILTLGTQRFYNFVLRPVVRIFRVSIRIAEQGVRQNSKNMAYVSFILAFILTFASLVSVSQDNEAVVQKLSEIQKIGGDFKLNTYQFTGSLLVAESIAHSKNQSAHVWIGTSSCYIFGTYVTVYSGDYLNYTRTVYDIGSFISAGKFSENGAVITKRLAIKYGFNVGDRITLTLHPEHASQYGPSTVVKSYRISGIAYSLPGLTSGSDGIFVCSKVTPLNSTLVIFRAKNYDALKEELEMSGLAFQSRNTKSVDENNLFFKTVAIFLVALGSATIFVINYSLYFNRRVEIALYRVRGATRSWIRRMLMAEGLSVMILSGFVGLSVGLALSYILSSFMYSSSSLPEFFIIGQNFCVVTVALFLVFLVSEYILSAIFARTNAVEVIRSNGGEM